MIEGLPAVDLAHRDLAEGKQGPDLRAAHSQGYTWTFVPIGYDRNGDPALQVTGILENSSDWGLLNTEILS
jgi:hypothetical protein